jgi:hypothetical protein
MNKKIFTLFIFFFAAGLIFTKADEGMWIPLFIEKYNIKVMQENGFKLTAEDIYSINKSSMKDAVMIFGGGCTAELISDQGLVITNHHCGYGRIQAHSSVEHDYLTHGFWAMSREEELSNPGLTVTFLVRMEDVTDMILAELTDEMDEKSREEHIQRIIDEIRQEAVEGTHYTASVRPFFHGNQYFLFVNEVFKDVRLVGAPPSAIGKFGGDTDNWIWPRHTGDFSLFRIYADKDNMPAEYSPDNVPYKPKKYFPVSIKGVKEGDFTMVFGYPGRTYEYVPSYHLEMLTNVINPEFIMVRGKKLDIINAAMNSSAKVRIQYSAKAAGVSNSWKRWIGENRGLEKLKTIEKKKLFEKKFQDWTNSGKELSKKYGSLISEYEKIYKKLTEYRFVRDYINEVFGRTGTEVVGFSATFQTLVNMAEKDTTEEVIQKELERLKRRTTGFFEDYHNPTGKKLFIAMCQLFDKNVETKFKPDIWESIRTRFKGDFSKYADYVFRKTIFADETKIMGFLSTYSRSKVKKIYRDPVFQLCQSVNKLYAEKVVPEYSRIIREIGKLNRLYMMAQMEMEKDKVFYPDANSTLRIAYGKVKGYIPGDGMYYKHYTTLKGIIEKDNPEIYDYNVPEKLKELFLKKDFGQYGQNGEMPVCFIATNHTTGGNSGSPVINAEGHLIGVNFDRVWEGVMSDLIFNPQQCRNISLDIRYALFIIDKFAGAGYLLDEMELVKE